MSTNFTLALSNPAVTGSIKNVVYTGLPDGNTLHVVIGNNFGFDMTIGGSSTGKFLDLSISGNILDTAAAATLRVKAPWSIASISPPAGAGGSYTFHLTPPAGGITLPNGSSITIELDQLAPTAKGTAQVDLHYQFDQQGDALSLSAGLSVLGAVNPDLAQLIGDDAPLHFSYYVNTGDTANPIMVSASPVTTDNAVENHLQLTLFFQPTGGDNGNLVNAWDPGNPPVFRVFFPYFSVQENLPAAFDLTDSVPQSARSGYNPITSAWNIAGALDGENAQITQNDFWQIGLDPCSPLPAWIGQPQPANTHLFTSTMGAATQPGPFLNLFFSHIFSGLPIDPDNPNTILYFQWLNFPGFNDGIAEFALRKSDLAITGFSGTVIRTAQRVDLQMTWHSINAAYCMISGDSGHQGTCATQESPYIHFIDVNHPLQSSYTLTAFHSDGVTQVSRRAKIRWQLDPDTYSVPTDISLQGLQFTPDGEKLLGLNLIDTATTNLEFFDPYTFQPLQSAPLAPLAALEFVVAPDADPEHQQIFMTTDDGLAGGFQLQTLQLTPGSGYNYAGDSEGPFVAFALTPDGKTLLLGTAKKTLGGDTQGTNLLVMVQSAGFQPLAGSPIALPDLPLQIVVGAQTGNIYVSTPSGVFAFGGTDFKSLPGLPLFWPALMAIAADESALYVLSAADNSPVPAYFLLTKADPVTMQVFHQVALDFGFFPYLEQFADTLGLATLTLSPDNLVLFISGLTVESIKSIMNQLPVISSVTAALNTQTLHQWSWSPVQSGNMVTMDVAISPDQTRIVLLGATDPLGDEALSFSLLDPSFQS